jgi:hypothetical protein
LGATSEPADAINGVWYETRSIATFENENGVEADTAWIDTSTFGRHYVLIQGNQIQTAIYDSDEETFELATIPKLRPGVWDLNGLEVTFSLKGNTLRGTSAFVTANNSHNVKVIREYRRDVVFPPRAWVPDTTMASREGTWIFKSGYFELSGSRQVVEMDTAKPLQWIFIVAQQDSMVTWYYDINGDSAVRKVNDYPALGGGRWLDTETGDTIYFRVRGDTLIHSNYQGSGKRKTTSKFRHAMLRYAGAVPPPTWTTTPGAKRGMVYPSSPTAGVRP